MEDPTDQLKTPAHKRAIHSNAKNPESSAIADIEKALQKMQFQIQALTDRAQQQPATPMLAGGGQLSSPGTEPYNMELAMFFAKGKVLSATYRKAVWY